MKRLILSTIAMLLTCSLVQGQELDLLTDRPVVLKEEQPGWTLGVDVNTFMRDAEFFLPYTKGYTALGFFLRPYAQHRLGRYVQLTMGVELTGVAGYSGLRAWQPVVRMEYEPFENFRLVMGSLYGTLSHGLYEPMFDRERYIYAHQEEGMQILAKVPFGYAGAGWTTDTWLHWENLLEPWQSDQERFTLGSNNEVVFWTDSPADGRRRWEVSVPLSFVGSHRGGQFSALDTCIQTLFNESATLRMKAWIGARDNLLRLDVPVFWYQDMSPKGERRLAYSNGWGVWPQVGADIPLSGKQERIDDTKKRGDWHLMVQGGYWYGYRYIAPRGSYLFQSVSWHDPNFAVDVRQMATARVAVENTFRGQLLLGADVELYYDVVEKGVDLAVGIYLRYTPHWTFK